MCSCSETQTLEGLQAVMSANQHRSQYGLIEPTTATQIWNANTEHSGWF